MLLLIIFILLTAIGVVLMKRNIEICEYIGNALVVVGGCAALICGVWIAGVKLSSDAEYEKMKAKYDALMTADKSDMVTLTKDIAEYNGEVKAGRELQKSPWVGLYQYDWWDALDTIEIGSIRKEEN